MAMKKLLDDPVYLHLNCFQRVEDALDEIQDIRSKSNADDSDHARYLYLLHRVAFDVFLMEHIFYIKS